MGIFSKIINLFKSIRTYYHNKIEIIDNLQKSLEEIERDLKRLQLLNLMQHNPENIDSIFMVAEQYFLPEEMGGLGGDWYMDNEFIKWANQYNDGVLPQWFNQK